MTRLCLRPWRYKFYSMTILTSRRYRYFMLVADSGPIIGPSAIGRSDVDRCAQEVV